MSWIVLLIGIALWWAAHLSIRLAPGAHDALGASKSRALVAVAVGIGLVLMVLGYRATPVVQLWYPPAVMTHINNGIMLFAAFFLFVGKTRGRMAARVRHPMLTAVKIWAVAHLLVNGDLASVLLFGSMLGWAVSEVVLINRSSPDWTPPEPAQNGDVKAVVVGALFYIVAVGIHVMAGLYALG